MCHRVEGQVRFGLPVPFKLDSIISSYSVSSMTPSNTATIFFFWIS